jgi:hypothetical protein
MAEALPYLKDIKISTNAGQAQGQNAGPGFPNPLNPLQMPGMLNQPLEPLNWQRRGGFQPGMATGKLPGMNFPAIPQLPQLPQAPINMFPMPGGGMQKQQPPTFPGLPFGM